MYSQFREENAKAKKSHRNTPSFSSSLLDEICRSIDDTPKPARASATGFRAKTKRDDETRSRLVEKWMENRRQNRIQCVFPENDDYRTDRERQRDSYLFDDYEEHERIISREQMKSSPKSRALKLYAGLKKMKQPISPGARLTTFINSIFNRSKSTKPKPKPIPRDSSNDHRKRASTAAEKIISDRRNNNNNNRVVIGRPPLPPNAYRNSTRCSYLGNHERDDDDEDEDEDDDDDALSESSSDLFELDHLSFGHSHRDIMFSELPVYETTVFHNNHPRFIR